jgi:hypothetical protein
VFINIKRKKFIFALYVNLLYKNRKPVGVAINAISDFTSQAINLRIIELLVKVSQVIIDKEGFIMAK